MISVRRPLLYVAVVGAGAAAAGVMILAGPAVADRDAAVLARPSSERVQAAADSSPKRHVHFESEGA